MASPPFNVNQAIPADGDIVAQHPANARLFRDIVESWLLILSDPATGYARIPFDTTANLNALNPAQPVASFRFDTTLQVLQIKTGVSTFDTLSFPPGTVMMFFAQNPPPGWTKRTDTEFSGAIIEITTSTDGGTFVGGTAVGSILTARTIAQANLPNVNFAISGEATANGDHNHGGATGNQSANHRHNMFDDQQVASHSFVDGNTAPAVAGVIANDSGNYQITQAGSPGEAVRGRTSENLSSHNHSISSSGTHAHALNANAASGGSGTALDFQVKRARWIVCQKN